MKEVGAEVVDFDAQVCRFVGYAWGEGELKQLANDLVAGLKLRVPAVKRSLNASTALCIAWAKLELPQRSPPISTLALQAAAAVAVAWNNHKLAFVLLLAFHALLRTGGIFALRCGHVHGTENDVGVIMMPFTKGTSRRGGVESVTVTDKPLLKVFRKLYRGCLPGEPVWPHSATYFRSWFAAIVEELGLTEVGIKPYSLRRGGATDHFLSTGQYDLVTERGRWAHSKTARIYINEGVLIHGATVMSPRIENRFRMLAAAYLPQLLRPGA